MKTTRNNKTIGGLNMHNDSSANIWIVVIAIVIAVATVSCGRKSDREQAGIGERAGIAIDQAVSNTVETSKSMADKTVEKTGEVLESAGEAMDRAGENMQK